MSIPIFGKYTLFYIIETYIDFEYIVYLRHILILIRTTKQVNNHIFKPDKHLFLSDYFGLFAGFIYNKHNLKK